MVNWKELSSTDYKNVWDFVYETLRFRPNADELILIPFESKSFNVSNFYNDNFDEELYEELHDYAIEWFKEVSKGNRIFALNWQHECFSFSPELPFERDEFGEWLISIFPNGDYSFFITSELKNGVFVDGINMNICLFGSEMIECLERYKPKIFR